MPDEADEIARTFATLYLGGQGDGTFARVLSEAIRSYGTECRDEGLEEAADRVEAEFVYAGFNDDGVMLLAEQRYAVGRYLRSLKSKPESKP